MLLTAGLAPGLPALLTLAQQLWSATGWTDLPPLPQAPQWNSKETVGLCLPLSPQKPRSPACHSNVPHVPRYSLPLPAFTFLDRDGLHVTNNTRTGHRRTVPCPPPWAQEPVCVVHSCAARAWPTPRPLERMVPAGHRGSGGACGMDRPSDNPEFYLCCSRKEALVQ